MYVITVKMKYPTKDLKLSDNVDTLPFKVSSTPIDWSAGVQRPDQEAKLGKSAHNAICVNIASHKAHHDIILSNTIGVSCKNSMIWPKPKEIISQLKGMLNHHQLLWHFLGADTKDTTFRDRVVFHALEQGKLAFTSGDHVVNDVSLNILKALKLEYAHKTKALTALYTPTEPSIIQPEAIPCNTVTTLTIEQKDSKSNTNLVQCHGTTKAGKKCKNIAYQGKYCHLHNGQQGDLEHIVPIEENTDEQNETNAKEDKSTDGL